MIKTEEDYLKDLVGFASVSGDISESKKCAQYCANFFEDKGLLTHILEYEGYPSIIATTKNTKQPKILLYCHLDIVPGKPELFIMKKTDGKLKGRGVFDMKFACASYMKIIDRLGSEVKNYDFGVMLVFDEEIGGHNGTEALLNNGFGCKACILPDSGQDWNIECNAKGAWFLRVSKAGKNAHASVPFEGINAAELLLPVVSKILELRDSYKYEDLSLNLTKNFSGAAMNQIPDYAEVIFDIRYRDESILKQIRRQIGQICTENDAKLETVEIGKCMNVDKDNEYVKKFIPIAEKVLGRKIKHADSAGSTDGRYFGSKGIPCIVIQPRGGNRHGDDEWIETGGMEKLTEMILQFIKQYAKIS
ncbi:M20 family metallopeptidase [Candidatus Parcubacteria bacterium]|nr:M20 family metallopeptidase [Candidatus Parcubacteria bacterium]